MLQEPPIISKHPRTVTRHIIPLIPGIFQTFLQGPLGGLLQDLHQIFSQGPAQVHARTSIRISAGSEGSSQDLPARTYKIFIKIFMPAKRISQNRPRRTCQRGPYKICIQEPPKRIPERLSYINTGHRPDLHARTCNTWHLQDLHARTF